MNLEHELNRQISLFQLGVPVYNEGGRLVVDEIPKVQLPTPNGMSPDAAALGDAPSPTFGNEFAKGTMRAIGGGLRDTAQGVLDVGAELIDNQNRMDNRPQFARDAVKDLLPNWEPESIAEGIARTGVNVVSALMLTRTLGMGGSTFGNVASGAVVDMLMDPTEGNLSSLARDFGFDNELTQFLDNKVAEDAAPEERLRARMLGVLEGAGLGALIDGVMKGFKVIKDNPEAAAKVVGGLGVAGLAMPQDAEGGPLDKIIRQVLKQDQATVNGLFKGKGSTALRLQAMDEVNRIRGEYPDGEGWRALELVGGSMKDGKFEPKWKQPAYGFDQPPPGVSKEEWKGQIVDKVVTSVDDVVKRAAQGDKDAEFILSQASWYRDMRNRLRDEFGGMADLFADLLGTTSAQTNVRTNWDNAQEIMRRFSRGEYDKEIANYERAIAAGEDPNKVFSAIRKGYEEGGMTKEAALAKALEEYPMLTKAAGTLFGTNSPTSTGALIDTFRQIKAGASPKTPNFTGNLIGYTNEATVDVWAARYLTDLAGLPRIPPPAEKAVSGKHGVGSTLENPRVGGEFGFGQQVFKEAADRINASNIVPGKTLGPDDLQAVAWFIEKEKWTKQGWTNKAGEGGSLDFEANRAGTSDPAALTEARRTINAGGPSDADRIAAQAELDQQIEGGLLDRIDGLRKQLRDKSLDKPQRDALQEQLDTELYTRDRLQKIIRSASPTDADRAAAQQTYEELAAPVDRTVLGISGERPGRPMSNYAQAELAAEIDDVLRTDGSVIMYKATNTYGRFMKKDERALDVEVVTRQGFDPAPLERRVVELGKEYDQDAVFVSRVLRQAPDFTNDSLGKSAMNARPGVEIYFAKKQSADAIRELTDILSEKGIDGFTFVTDMRHSDRVNVQARAGGPDTAGLVGVRFQYIPEFDDAYNAGRHRQMIQEKADLFQDVIEEIGKRGGVSSAQVVWYDTKVFFRDQYDGILGTAAPSGTGGGKVREGQLLGSGAPRSDRQGGSRPVGSGAVPDR